MKKVTLMLTALALVLGISQCKKQENPVPVGEKQFIELTADNGNDGSKVSGSFSAAAMNLVWDDGDVITVSGGAEGTLTLDRGAGTSQGHFAGEVKLVSRADLVFTWTNLEGEPEYNNQAGTEDWIKDNLVLEARNAYNDNGKYSLKMEMPYAVLKLNLNALVGESGNDVEISTGSDPVATVKNLTKANSEEVYMAVPEVGEHTYTFSGNGESVDKSWTLEANTYYTAGTDGAAIEIKSSRPEGALKGLFSISATKKVCFSKGNLQYIGSASPAYWKFADHQYDVLGDNGQGSDSEDVDRDLFGWGTSGFAYSGHGNMYQPYSTGTVDADYHVTDYYYGNSDFVDYGYYLSVSTQSDWGANPIRNGGNEAGKWRTLSLNEFSYLLSYRTNAWKLNTLGKVGETAGIFLLPDEETWTLPEGVADFEVGMFMNWDEVNNYSYADWAKLEASGVVFLPVAGWRDGTSLVKDESGRTYYWTSVQNYAEDDGYYANSADVWGFANENLIFTTTIGRHQGCPVRLVMDAE